MNIYLREVRANLKSLLIWTVVMFLLILIGTSKYDGYRNNPELLKVLDSMPRALIEALEMHAFNLTTLEGFFGIMFVYLALMGAVAAAMWGSGVLAQEERNKTAEFLLTLPVTRTRVVTAKALAALTNCIAFVLITWAISLALIQKYNPDEQVYRFVAQEMGAMFFIEIIFLALGLFLAAMMRNPKRAGSATLAVILVTYFMSLVQGMHERLDALKYITPFKYVDPARLLHEGRIDTLYLVIGAVIVVVCVAGTYVAYSRRDVYI